MLQKIFRSWSCVAVYQINHAEVGIVAVSDDNLHVQCSVRVVEIRTAAIPSTSSNMRMMSMTMMIGEEDSQDAHD